MNDLLLRALRSEETPRRPLWIMRQAGRYLPEYRALRAEHSFEELIDSPKLAAQATMMPIDRYGFDAAIIFADLMSPLAALGTRFRFDPGPVLDRPIRTARQIEDLPEPDPQAVAPEVSEALGLVRRELDGRAALIGFAGAPLSLAAYLVEGRGTRGFPNLRALAASDERAFSLLLEKLARLAAGYAVCQSRAGADVIQIFDSWAGLLSYHDWRRLVRPHLLSLLEELRRGDVRTILFAHDAPHLVESFAELPSDGLAVDYKMDLAELRTRLGPQKALQGNLDPAVLLAGPEVTARATRRLLSRVPARGHIFNLGHGITPEAPLESVSALIETVRAEQAAGRPSASEESEELTTP